MIIRGTTPTIRYRLKVIDPQNITEAFLTFKQGCGANPENWPVVLEKNKDSMVSGENYIEWTLTQADTLTFETRFKVDYQIKVKLNSGLVGASSHKSDTIGAVNKEGEI